MTDGARGPDERGSWARWLILACGVLFGLGAIVNLLQGDWANGIGGCALAAVGIGGFAVIERERQRRVAFLTWLYANAEQVRRGTACWEGIAVSPQTELVTFDAVLSVLIMTTSFPSSYVLRGHPSASSVQLGTTLVSLCLGWWGIPFGPILTLKAVYRNLRGGERVYVGDLLCGMRR